MPYRLTLSERETVIRMDDDSKGAKVFTWQKRVQRRLQAKPEARLIRQGTHEHPDDRWMEFEVPKDLVTDLVTVRARRVLSPAQREHAKSLHQRKPAPTPA